MMSDTLPFPRHDDISALLQSRNSCLRLGGSIVAATDVILPNGSQVVIIIEGGASGERVTASDAGAALISVSEAGFSLDEGAYSSVKRFARSLGLSLSNGVLRSEPVSPDEAAYAVVTLANGVREVARLAFEAGHRQERKRFRERVEGELSRIFVAATVRKSARLRGASEDNLRFDYLVTLDPSRRLVVDAPVPDGSSIAAVVLRQSDLRAAHIMGLHQAIIYDEEDRWPSASLSQLRLAQVPLVSARRLQVGLTAVTN